MALVLVLLKQKHCTDVRERNNKIVYDTRFQAGWRNGSIMTETRREDDAKMQILSDEIQENFARVIKV